MANPDFGKISNRTPHFNIAVYTCCPDWLGEYVPVITYVLPEVWCTIPAIACFSYIPHGIS